MSIQYTHHVGLTVSDLETMTAFYTDVLGLAVLDRFSVGGEAFETATECPGASASFVHLDGGDLRIELVSYDPAGDETDADSLDQPGVTHLGLAVDDLDAVVRDLPADVDTVSEPQTTESGTQLVFLRDPEGNLVELLEVA